MNTFVFADSDEDHWIGTQKCRSGWCGDGPYPLPHDECGGLIHANWGDENWDGDYWLYTKCDRCGEKE